MIRFNDPSFWATEKKWKDKCRPAGVVSGYCFVIKNFSLDNGDSPEKKDVERATNRRITKLCVCILENKVLSSRASSAELSAPPTVKRRQVGDASFWAVKEIWTT